MKRNQIATLTLIPLIAAACNSDNCLTPKIQEQMFTAEQIKTTLSEVRTGADFPRIAIKLKNLGITRYETRMEDGQSVFYGIRSHQVHTAAAYAPIPIADRINAVQLQADIKNHQQGGSDYFQISRQSADNGIAKWAVDLEEMTCSYLDRTGKPVWVEDIPDGSSHTAAFSIAQIRAAHAKVKSGADFPAYVQEMKGIGVTSYDHDVRDGHIVYHGKNGFRLIADAKWPPVRIADAGNEASLRQALINHQQGQTDYPTFCLEAAGAGVARWTVDMHRMTCTYYDKSGAGFLREDIPQP